MTYLPLSLDTHLRGSRQKTATVVQAQKQLICFPVVFQTVCSLLKQKFCLTTETKKKKKDRSRYPLLCTFIINKDGDKLLPTFSSSFPLTLLLMVHEYKRKQTKESSPKILICSSNAPSNEEDGDTRPAWLGPPGFLT